MTCERLRQLLETSFESLERRWAEDPTSEELGLALTVKEFMRDYGVQDADEGLRLFRAFKESQSESLGNCQVPELPSA